jgi:hypothetical protein
MSDAGAAADAVEGADATGTLADAGAEVDTAFAEAERPGDAAAALGAAALVAAAGA